jgi:predicted ester cyclase
MVHFRKTLIEGHCLLRTDRQEGFAVNTGQNKALMRDFLTELDKGLEAVDRFFSPDCLARLPGALIPTDRKGLKAFIGMLYSAFPDLSHTILDQIAELDKVTTLVRAGGTHTGAFLNIPPTGKSVVITDIMIVRILDGKVVELWAQFDLLGLFQQLGVSL